MEKEILKKTSAYFAKETKYGFIKKWSSDYPVTLICKAMQVKYGSYYTWTIKSTKAIPLEELELRCTIKELFDSSRQSLGNRMMVKNLQLKGFTIGRYKVRKLMKSMKLKVKTK